MHTLSPVYFSLGLGVTWFGGDATTTVPMSQLFTNQAHLSSEFGLRLSPAWAIGMYGDAGGGDLSASVRQQCSAQPVAMGMDCIGVAGRFGFLVRHTWSPLSSVSKWFTIGTGWELADVSRNDPQGTSLFTLTGRERLRLGAGFDLRGAEVLGIGLYGSFSWGQFDRYEDAAGSVALKRVTHTTGQVGVRLTLFP
jgi:hypothetical protein